MKRVQEKALALLGLVAFLGACGGGNSTYSASAQAGQCKSSDTVDRSKPDSLYQIAERGFTFDTRTGLIWDKCLLMDVRNQTLLSSAPGLERCEPAARYSWSDALAAANTANMVNYGGYNDWRVPNAKELLSLVDDGCGEVAMNTTYFRQVLPASHWTSSPNVVRPGKAWAVDLNVHSSADDLQVSGSPWMEAYNKLYVRLVRGPQR